MRTVPLLFGLLLILGAHAGSTRAQQATDSTYTVRDDDTLYSIAQDVGASVRSLMRWNNMEEPSIQTGQTLWIRPPADPSRSPPRPAGADSTAPGASRDSSTTASADTTVSDTSTTAAADPTPPDTSTGAAPDTATGAAADTTAADTSAAATDSTAVDTSTAAAPETAAPDTGAGTTTAEPDSTVPPDTAVAPRPYGRYTVRPGDTFISLALRLGMPADSLVALNDSTTAPLTPDSTLRLPRRFGPLRHVVETGQTLYSIAGEYGVSVRALRAVNDNLNPESLQPGQRLQIPGRRHTEIPPPGTWAAPDTTGRVARYPEAFAGRLTASGTAYDPDDLVISHPSLPFNSVVLLATPDDEKQTFARVIDRGPIEEGTVLDVSEAVADELALPTDSPSVSLRLVWKNRDAN